MSWRYISIIIFYLLIAGFVFAQIPLGILDIENATGLALDILYYPKENRVVLNSRNLNSVDFFWEKPEFTSGDFAIEMRSVKNEVLYSGGINLQPGRNMIIIPYFVNINAINIKNLDGRELLGIQREDLSVVNTCNENNICEDGEENLCPLDCKTANNPVYPQTPGIASFQFSQTQQPTQFQPTRQPPQPLGVPSFTPEASQQQFQISLSFVAGGLLIILIIFSLVYWYNKRK